MAHMGESGSADAMGGVNSVKAESAAWAECRFKAAVNSAGAVKAFRSASRRPHGLLLSLLKLFTELLFRA